MINRRVWNPLGLPLIISGALLLSGCFDDDLAVRKKACADYVRYGVLQGGETQHCVADEEAFRKAASKLVAADVERIYAAFLVDAAEISASTAKADLPAYAALPQSIEDPIFFDDSDAIARSLPASVDLVKVTFEAPSNTNRQWQISGYRAGKPEETWLLDLDGFGPTQSSQIADNCGLLANSSAGNGCEARVFATAISPIDPDLKRLVAVAIEVTPPSSNDAYEALLANEMRRWPPKDRK